VVRVGYDTLTVADAAALHLPAGRPWLEPGTEVAVVVPGTTRLRGDWYLTVQECDEWSWEEITTNADSLVAWMRTEALVGGKARLRTRREGDVFRPHGLGGSQVRLSDFLINVKVPLRWRDHLPLLVADGSILWVVGERLSEGALVRRDEGRVLRLEFGRTEPPVAGGCDAR
jgi:tRNA(Ile)-lysidine synthase